MDGMIAMKGITKPGEYTVNIAWKLLDGTPLTEKTSKLLRLSRFWHLIQVGSTLRKEDS